MSDAAPAVAPTEVPRDVLAAHAEALPAAALAVGAAVPGAVFAAAGVMGWWVFGLVFVATAGGVWLVLHHARLWLARLFYVPLRRPWVSALFLLPRQWH